MANFRKTLARLFTFEEPKTKERFILKETEEEMAEGGQKEQDKKVEPRKKKNEGLQLNKKSGENEENKGPKPDISKALSENMERIKDIYSIPTNGDAVLREFDLVVKNKVIPAFMVFFDGMTDRKVINDDILQPLMLLSNLDIKSDEKSIADYIRSHILPHNQLKEFKAIEQVVQGVNFGGCGIFIDGVDSAFVADVKGWEHRAVERPNTEQTIRGPQEGFTELLRANTALIRKILNDEDLIAESLTIGRRSRTPCSMMYIKDITNDSLVKEVRRRLKSIKVDYLFDSGELEQLIEDSSFLPVPQIMVTERPDKAASMLAEGKVVVVMHGSPFALCMPVTNNELLHSPEDSYVRFPYANLLRFVRIMGVFLSLLLPGLYVAITNYHQEMIPTSLLFAIEASRERVPFPSVVEILIMEISFELIREAGIRIPGPIGPTLGIIGALILGQAAVAANIVSPILIIIVAVTGIGSFAIPNFALALGFRVLRYAYILLGAIAGFLGITTGLFLQGIWFVSEKSFGVPYMAPFASKTAGGIADQFARPPFWKQEKRADYMNVKDARKQPHISRGWKSQEGEDQKEEDDDAGK
ncbi:MAG: spore germination protein [Clostridiales bacterium]|nr:spore germination protein [Eubacteriales bacterium]MDH7566653.1 spore germination protein [Clostridiales bacterium]